MKSIPAPIIYSSGFILPILDQGSEKTIKMLGSRHLTAPLPEVFRLATYSGTLTIK